MPWVKGFDGKYTGFGVCYAERCLTLAAVKGWVVDLPTSGQMHPYRNLTCAVCGTVVPSWHSRVEKRER